MLLAFVDKRAIKGADDAIRVPLDFGQDFFDD